MKLQLAVIALLVMYAVEDVGAQYAADTSGRSASSGLQNDIDYLRHEQGNFTSELAALTGKFNALENVLSLMRQELNVFQKNQGRQLANQVKELEAKISKLESTQKDSADSVKQVKLQGNELAAAVKQFTDKTREYDSTLSQQSTNIKNLQSALNSLLALEQHRVESRGATSTGDVYTVQSGDTLDKIARRNNVTIASLRSANSLDKDRIVVGQKLQIPKTE